MIITDTEGKERRIKDDLKVVVHNNMNALNPEEIAEQIEYVEVTIIGKNRQWKNWYPLDEFKRLNPDIEI